MSEENTLSAQLVSTFIATAMVKSAKGQTPQAEGLASAISEIELETQIAGASFIKVSVVDPYWVLATSGWLDVSDEGLLDEIEVEFPEKSGWMWTLCAVEITNDVTQPNLILTFEDRIIARLRKKWGPKNIPSGATTRAQFVKALVDEVGVSGKEPAIKFVCPELNVLQPVETKTEGELETEGAAEQTATKANKGRAVSAASAVTIKGVKPTPEQIKNINIAMGVANAKAAPPLATEALLEACIQENTFTNTPGGDGTSSGLLQFLASTAASLGINPLDAQQCCEAFLTRSYSAGTSAVGGGGAIEYTHKYPSKTPDEVAQAAQGSAFPKAYAQWKAEAQVIIHAYGGVTLGTKATGETDVPQLKRGSTSNPDEDSWECITRLAQQVSWFAFSDGNILFYMDGPALRDQEVTLFLNVPENLVYRDEGRHKVEERGVIQIPLTANFDNTAFLYRSTHPVKGRTQRKSRISKPSTPSEVKMQLVCAPEEYRAGDVFEFVASGPINKRWIVTDATRNCLKDTFTTFTLEPPVAPLPEPEAAETNSGAKEPGSEGSASSVAEAAKKALTEQQAKHCYEYSEESNRENNGTLFGPAPRTMDCSAFATLCYKAAGLPDPSNKSYSPIGDTSTIIANCKKVSNPKPGAFCFFGSSEAATTHVTIYVGGGKAISMGQQGDPEEGSAETTGPAGFLGYYEVKA